ALAALGLAFTGSGAAAIWLTTDKSATRAVLASERLPVAPGGRLDLDRPDDLLGRVPPPWILKPGCEDASIGLEGDAVVHDRAVVLARAEDLARRFPGQPIVLESYLPGREFNVSLLATDQGGVEVLPVAELAYVGFPECEPRILGWEAKWNTGSDLYARTVRQFPKGPEDAQLLARAAELARAAWRACGLAGYARVDLRCDARGEPCILEVNANPCLAPDAGFLAAAAEAGLAPAEVVRRILDAALRDRPAVPESQAEPPRAKPRPDIALRDLHPDDRPALEALLRATRFFNPEELEVALELVDDRLNQGPASHYRFLVGEIAGEVAGYSCWGPIPGTAASADLYWIAVIPQHQGEGAGAALLAAAEDQMLREGRSRVYVETSTRAQYHPTRAFYLACGYHLAAELPDFYAPGDGKAILVKVVG
ncbi:MAG TPA: GNAT family N-acetyltransferase, partial [Thermoanaerobaculia bacterium]|nr:GNAT family N-acetyltransferase [Thermoanaerobaculia bacterium]